MSNSSDKYETYYKYNQVNDRDPIIFIHGIGLNHEIWDDQTNYFKNYNTIIYDLIGHGKTPFNKKKITMEHYTQQLLDLVDGLNVKKFHYL